MSPEGVAILEAVGVMLAEHNSRHLADEIRELVERVLHGRSVLVDGRGAPDHHLEALDP